MTDVSMLRFLFIFYTLHVCNVVKCAVNTGTVLFSASDVHRKCWHPEEIAVLTTRVILQDVLPDANFFEINNNDYVDDIIDYFKLLFDDAQRTTGGRSKHITMLALTDLIGGYLQHAVLPVARQAYYAGVIDFTSMEKLIQLYEELKWFLRTNGQGWAGPIQPKTQFDVEPVDLSNEGQKGNRTCCRNLIYYQRPPIKRADKEEDRVRKLFFPIPFFDSKVRPSAIAVPFKRYALRNIESKRAAYLVMRYYISVHNCMRDLRADRNTVETFQNNLFAWIENTVLPKLKDDKFYSAFGGILRVQESLRAEGARIDSNEPECFENEGDQEVGAVPGGETSSRSSIVLISMLVTIFIWFIIGTLFICYRIQSNSKKSAVCKMAAGTSDSSSSFGSRWSSSKRTIDTCKCCTTTDKSTENNSSISSEFDKEEEAKYRKTGKRQDKKFFSRACLCEPPPTIDPKHSMKLLPSIPEISENSSSRRDDWKQTSKSRRISFDEPTISTSKEDLRDLKRNITSKLRVCVPRMADIDVTVCPRYDEKATSLSSSKSKSTNGKEISTQMSEVGLDDAGKKPEISIIKEKNDTVNDTTEDTSDNTAVTANSPHIYACHSSLTGNYTTEQQFNTERPFIFGYDFQTSSSSELSDEESDARTSTTK